MEGPLVGLVFVHLFSLVAGAFTCTLDVTVTKFDVSCHDSCDGNYTVTPFGGVPPYYFMDPTAMNPQWIQAASFSRGGLCPNNNLYLNVKDSTPQYCEATPNIIIGNPPTLQNIPPSTTPISCYGANDGTITLSATGGTPPYRYKFNGQPYDTKFFYTGLAPASYTYQVMDSRGCSVPQATTAVSNGGKNQITVSSTGYGISCYGRTDGNTTLTATGGSGSGFKYSLDGSPYSTTRLFSNLGAGTHQYSVRDNSDGCLRNGTIPVTGKNQIIAFGSPQPISCYGRTDGSFAVSKSGGNPTWYQLNYNKTGWDTIWHFSSLGAGVYPIQVRDADYCVVSFNVTVPGKTELVANAITTGTSCWGVNDGTASLYATGGNSAHYDVKFELGEWGSTWNYTGMPAATYGAWVRDADGCTAFGLVYIPGKMRVYANIVTTNPISCYGTTDGNVTLAASGGNSSSYQINFNGQGWNTQWSYGALGPGTYNFLVRDGDLCEESNAVSVANKYQVFASVATSSSQVCVDTPTGTAYLSASGGTGSGYTIDFDNRGWGNTWNYTSLDPGYYPFNVRDSDNCFAFSSVTIDPATAITSSATSTPQTTCSYSSSGSITITATGGAPPLYYSIDGSFFQSSNYFTFVAAGDYTYTVRDSNMCTVQGSVNVAMPTSTLIAAATPTHITCPTDGNTGQILVSANGGVPPYSFSVDDSVFQNASLFTGLADGAHDATVMDANMCSFTVTGVTILRPQAFEITINSHQQSCSGGNTAGISFDVSGANGGYIFMLNGVLAAAVNNELLPGTYNWEITDSKGCSATGTETIDSITVLPPPIITSVSSIPTNGGFMTITGSNFNTPLLLKVDGIAISFTYFNTTVMVCGVIPGTGKDHLVYIESGTLPCKNSIVATWSYARPIVNGTSAIGAASGPLTITGTNFGSEAAVITVTVSATYCTACTFINGSVECLSCPGGTGTVPLVVTVDGLDSFPFGINYATGAPTPLPTITPPTTPPTLSPPTPTPTPTPTTPTPTPTTPTTPTPTPTPCGSGFTYNGSTCVDINECELKMCDRHVQCTNSPGNFSCAPCPIGFTGNSYNVCESLCGNGICEPLALEDCVTCSRDCNSTTTCGKCGDGVCDTDKRENCNSCYEDCKHTCAPVQCQGTPVCSAHGSCVDGTCVCNGDYSGPTCNVYNNPIHVGVNQNTSNVVISPSQALVAFKIGLKALREISENNTVVTNIDISEIGFHSTNDSEGTGFTFNATLSNAANLTISIKSFTNTSLFKFANKTSSFAANTIKLGVTVSNWPFNNLRNTLALVFDARDTSTLTQPCNIDSSKDGGGSLKWITIAIDNVVMYGQFLEDAVIDGKYRIITYNLNDDGSVSAILPHFWLEAEMDPSYSVLVGSGHKDSCDQIKSSKQVSHTVLIAVIVSVGGAVILAAAAYFIIPKARLAMKVRKEESAINLNEVNSSGYGSVNAQDTEPSWWRKTWMKMGGSPGPTRVPSSPVVPSIERAQDMEVQTVAGRFTVKL